MFAIPVASATPVQQPESSVVRGTFLIYNSWAHFLFDSGASHSFLSASFAWSLELDVLESPVFVDTPVGGRVRLDRICRGCEFTMGDHQFAFDFIVLDMSGFDLILGMDWLSSVHSLQRVCLFLFMVTESHQLMQLCMIRKITTPSAICSPVIA